MTRLLRRTITLLLAIAPAVCMQGQNDYARLESKATRFFDNQEWASANAMYLLMLEERPTEASTYARAVVVDIMAGDTLQALEMVPRSMSYEVPIDSLLTGVRNISFSIGRGNLYEHYLLKIKETYPWFGRVADNYLMQYYAFRQNGPELIRYARTMLEGLPDNLNFMRMLAYGLLIDGYTEQAIETWTKTARLYPDNYDTMLDLANCHEAAGNFSEALVWMERALKHRYTPYVAASVDRLRLQASQINLRK